MYSGIYLNFQIEAKQLPGGVIMNRTVKCRIGCRTWSPHSVTWLWSAIVPKLKKSTVYFGVPQVGHPCKPCKPCAATAETCAPAASGGGGARFEGSLETDQQACKPTWPRWENMCGVRVCVVLTMAVRH